MIAASASKSAGGLYSIGFCKGAYLAGITGLVLPVEFLFKVEDVVWAGLATGFG